MDYEKIIVELLGRIQMLESQVSALMEERLKEDDEKMTTNDIREYILAQKNNAKERGIKKLVLVARDIHRDLNLKQRYPMVCNAMRDCMQSGDKILFQPPKGNSSTLEIEYYL